MDTRNTTVSRKSYALLLQKKRKAESQLHICKGLLVFQVEERKRCEAELIVSNNKIAFQEREKKEREAELLIADKELVFQSKEKENRASELVIANKELVYQYREREKRAAELLVANEELLYQNKEKENRAAELLIANAELVYQNKEKEKRAAELLIANEELLHQNKEKDRAALLMIANKELHYQNEKKEKRAVELQIANKELEQVTYIASHDLQEPLRTILSYMEIFEEDYITQLDETAVKYISTVNGAAKRMSILVKALLHFSRLGHEKKLSHVSVKNLVADVLLDLQSLIIRSHAIVEVGDMPEVNLYEMEFGQLFQNLISNAIKFQKPDIIPHIKIWSENINGKWKFSVSDNGIGIADKHFERIFDVFQRLHINNEYEGAGIGLANCKKIVELHHGTIWMESELGKGTTVNFEISELHI